MLLPQRRLTPRTNFGIAVQCRYPDKQGPKWTGQSINLSKQGAYLYSDLTPNVGELLEVVLEMPEEFSERETAMCCVVAKVIHVEAHVQVAGKSGIGVKFLYYRS